LWLFHVLLFFFFLLGGNLGGVSGLSYGTGMVMMPKYVWFS